MNGVVGWVEGFAVCAELPSVGGPIVVGAGKPAMPGDWACAAFFSDEALAMRFAETMVRATRCSHAVVRVRGKIDFGKGERPADVLALLVPREEPPREPLERELLS